MDDLITKQSALDMIHKTIYDFFDIDDDDSEEPISEKDELLLEVNKAICNGIKDLPERKKGEWIDIWDKETDSSDSAICSVCEMHSVRPLGRFCKWCGADMREVTK